MREIMSSISASTVASPRRMSNKTLPLGVSRSPKSSPRLSREASATLSTSPVARSLLPVSPSSVPSFPFEGPHRVQIASVYDGDTVVIIIGVGGSGGGGTGDGAIPIKLALRIDGIDTPEIRGKTLAERSDAIVSRNRVMQLLGFDPTAQTTYRSDLAVFANVYLVRWDKFGGRVIGSIYTPDGQSVAEILLKEKLARSYHGERKPLAYSRVYESDSTG